MPRTFTVTIDSPAQMLAALPLEADAEQEQHWLADALSWLRSAPIEERTQRLEEFTQALSTHPLAPDLRLRLRKIWTHHSLVRVLTEAGLPDEPAFFEELAKRLANKVLPRVLPAGGDLYGVLNNVGLSVEDAGWVATLPPQLMEFWGELLRPTTDSVLNAARLLAIRAAAVALARDMLPLREPRRQEESPFFRLTAVVERLMSDPGNQSAQADWKECFTACRAAISERHAQLEVSGVNTNLIFGLELLSSLLNRIDTLYLLTTDAGRGRAFAVEVVGGFADHRGIMPLFRAGGTHLARKIVEHTGRTGGHYIASSAGEWRVIGYGAVGAGVLTAFTALFKFGIGSLPLAPAIAGLAYWANYSFFFVLMQLMHLALASKMPAMTAAALADALVRNDGTKDEVEMIAAMARTQFVVTIANLIGAMPMAIAVDALWRWKFGYPYLPIAYSHYGLESVHPFLSWSVVFALVTGLSLWLSSLATGWTANWVAFRSLPAAIEQSRRIRDTIGLRLTRRLARFVQAHLSGIAGYLTLGFLLGFVPMLTKFLGISYDVRHVTLAAASLAYAWSSLFHNGQLELGPALWSAGGIAVVGLCNFSAAFALGLWLALRSRSVSYRHRVKLLRALSRELVHQPGRFFFPPRGKPVQLAPSD